LDLTVTRQLTRLEDLIREGDLFGDTPLSTYCEASKVRGGGFARCFKAKGAGTPLRGGAGWSRRRSGSRRRD